MDVSDLMPALRKLDADLSNFTGKHAEFAERLLALEQKGAAPSQYAAAESSAAAGVPALFDAATGRKMPVLTKDDTVATIAHKMADASDKPAGSLDAESGDASLRDFLRGVAGMKTSPWAQKALSVGTDSAGGFTVPTQLMPNILGALFAQSSMLAAGTRMVMLTAGAKSYNVAGINALPTAAWRAESASVAESDPTFRNVQLTPRSLSFRFKVSRELLADSPNLNDSTVNAMVAAAFGVALDLAGLRGSGTAPTPRGLLNQAGMTFVDNGANGASLATVRWANLLSAYQTIIGANATPPTAAIMAPRSLVGFASLAATDNQPLMRPQLLEALRFLHTSQIPVNLTTGTSTDTTEIYVGDFTRSFWGVREGVSILMSPHTAAGTGEVEFFCHWRGDFAVEYVQSFNIVRGLRP
jgi:HK97 family phage major capsid protein